MSKIAILNYGLGNIYSVLSALTELSYPARVINNYSEISNETVILLPGVGAFSDGIAGIRKCGFDDLIKNHAARERPILGICLGAQLLATVGYENGRNLGLGIFDASVEKLPQEDTKNQKLRLPNVGWSKLIPSSGVCAQQYSDLFKTNKDVYLVHSYHIKPKNEQNIIAYSSFSDHQFGAMVGVNNIVGCQFHPEKSGTYGLTLLDRVIKVITK